MIKGSTHKKEAPSLTEDGVDLSDLSVAKGWLTLQKYSLTRGTRILVVSTVMFVVLIVVATITFLSLGWMHDATELHAVHETVSSQRSQLYQLEKNYTALYSEYVGAVHEAPNAPTPSDANTSDALVCPMGTALKDFTVETLADGTQTFLGCQVTQR
jgi:hypothetical protein